MARTTISLPDRLVERLDPYRDVINISEICRDALEGKVSTMERITGALAEGDERQALIERLREGKKKFTEVSVQNGMEDGRKWATEDATFADLMVWAETNAQRDSGLLLPEQVMNSYLQEAEWIAQSNADFFDQNRYVEGFMAGLREVWESVKDEV